MTSYILRSALVASVALTAVSAWADTAADHAKHALVAYDLQDWETAIREYQAAYQSDQRPEYLWGIAQAQRLQGNCGAAIITYKAFRRSEVSPKAAAAADAHIANCEADLSKKKPAPSSPIKEATTTPTPPPTARPESIGRKRFYEDPVFDVLAGAGLVGFGIGGYFFVAGNTDMRAADSSATYAEHASASSLAKREQLVGVLALSAGVLFTVGATYRFLTLGPREHAEVALGPSGITLRGWF